MFIPIENENAICMTDVIAMIRSDKTTNIITCDGNGKVGAKATVFTPNTLEKRLKVFYSEGMTAAQIMKDSIRKRCSLI